MSSLLSGPVAGPSCHRLGTLAGSVGQLEGVGTGQGSKLDFLHTPVTPPRSYASRRSVGWACVGYRPVIVLGPDGPRRTKYVIARPRDLACRFGGPFAHQGSRVYLYRHPISFSLSCLASFYPIQTFAHSSLPLNQVANHLSRLCPLNLPSKVTRSLNVT